MLTVIGIVASCNVSFVAWRMWVAQRHPRDAAPRELGDAVPAASTAATSWTTPDRRAAITAASFRP